ncbi:hypothetical protein [Verrucomicrobium spinosum]|uniref:hypothetical protein n=1 Tax=Verrucomicrobium spinosum TaxID=2736 RepID=UPI0012E29DD3|nr:hypothetical protein [Verrucomicrobium spinosum]
MIKAPATTGAGTPATEGKSLRERVEHQWHLFASDQPGERFVNLHKRRQEQRQGNFSWSRILFVGAGILLIIAGLFFMAVPGPGLPVLVAGLGLMGSESLVMARGLDWTELKLRPPVLKLKTRWDALTSRTRLYCWCGVGALVPPPPSAC